MKSVQDPLKDSLNRLEHEDVNVIQSKYSAVTVDNEGVD